MFYILKKIDLKIQFYKDIHNIYYTLDTLKSNDEISNQFFRFGSAISKKNR